MGAPLIVSSVAFGLFPIVFCSSFAYFNVRLIFVGSECYATHGGRGCADSGWH